MNTIDYIPMMDIRNANIEAGQHWFDVETLRFFRSRVANYAVSGPGGIFFTSSERGPDDARRYSVRQAIDGGRRIETIGKFQGHQSRSSAVIAAQLLAEGGAL